MKLCWTRFVSFLIYCNMNMASKRERKSHGREIIKPKALPNSRTQKNMEEADERVQCCIQKDCNSGFFHLAHGIAFYEQQGRSAPFHAPMILSWEHFFFFTVYLTLKELITK